MFNKKQTRKYQLKHRKTARKQFNNVKHKYSSTVKKMRGGSPQSNIVMSETSMRPMSDYVTSPRIRVKGYDNSLSSVLSSQRPQMGGSPASDLVMANLTNTPNTNNKSMFNESLVKGDINSLKLYNTTGGMVNTIRVIVRVVNVLINIIIKLAKQVKAVKTVNVIVKSVIVIVCVSIVILNNLNALQNYKAVAYLTG